MQNQVGLCPPSLEQCCQVQPLTVTQWLSSWGTAEPLVGLRNAMPRNPVPAPAGAFACTP